MLLLLSLLRFATADKNDFQTSAVPGESPDAATIRALERSRRELFHKLRRGVINHAQFREAELSLRQELIEVMGHDPSRVLEAQRRREELLRDKRYERDADEVREEVEQTQEEDHPDMHGHGGEIEPRGSVAVVKRGSAVLYLIAVLVLLVLIGTVIFLTRRRRVLNKWRKRSDRLPSVFETFV
jgi:hypothetical protein